MATDVLLIDTLSTMRIDLGFISPSSVNAQLSGFLEQEGIDFAIEYAVPREDGEIGILRNNDIVHGSFQQILAGHAPRIVALFHDPELTHLALPVAEKVRSTLPEALLCIGNSIASALPGDYLNRGFDYVCGQDVFTSFITLVKKILDHAALPKGVFAVPHTYQNLDHFPFISKRFFENARPQWSFADSRVLRFGLITGSLGCTGGCAHCHNSAFWGRTWRPMRATRIAAEMQFQKELLQVNTFYLGDINFLPNTGNGNSPPFVHPQAAQRLTELDELLPAELRFISTTRPDTISSLKAHAPELLERYLRRMSICFLGVESFNSNILSGLKPKVTRQMIKDAITVLAERDISIVASFIVGNPAETHASLEETEEFIMHELPASAVPILNIMTPFPGTRFYTEMQEKGLLLKDDVRLFNGQHLLFRHPVFEQGELESHIREFYYKFFSERYAG